MIQVQAAGKRHQRETHLSDQPLRCTRTHAQKDHKDREQSIGLWIAWLYVQGKSRNAPFFFQISCYGIHLVVGLGPETLRKAKLSIFFFSKAKAKGEGTEALARGFTSFLTR